MITKVNKQEIVHRLKRDLLQWQGLTAVPGTSSMLSFGPLDEIFPGGDFPIRAVHEFISTSREDSAATSGFMSALLSTMLKNNKVCLWIGTHRAIFPPAIHAFNLKPEQFLFIEMDKQQDVFWAIEEALKCRGLGAIVGELSALNFLQSRRLQLGVEQSGVTTFILRHSKPNEGDVFGTTASSLRWRIRPLPSRSIEEGMPGVGFPLWFVQTLKVRNGHPGQWVVEWNEGEFQSVNKYVEHAEDVLVEKSAETRVSLWERRASG